MPGTITGDFVAALIAGILSAFLALAVTLLQLRYLAVAPVVFILMGAVAVLWTRALNARVVGGVYAGLAIALPVTIAWQGPDPVVSIINLAIAVVPTGAGLLAGEGVLGWSRYPPGRRPWLRGLVFLIPAVLVASLAVDIGRDPLRDTDMAIRDQLLVEAPLGSSMSAVEAIVSRRGWELKCVSETRGFFDQRLRPSRVTGAKHIEAYAGHYQNVFRVDVVVYWGFDEQGRLIDVWVWKTVDAL